MSAPPRRPRRPSGATAATPRSSSARTPQAAALSTARSTAGSAAGSAARFAARARQVRWRSRWRAVLWALAAVAVVTLAVLLWTGPLLIVRGVEVQSVGGPALTPAQAAQVRERGEVPMRRPLARVDTEAVARRAERVRFVADVRVVRGWPSTLRLEVRQRVAVAAVPTSDGVRLVDDQGVAYAEVASAPEGVPVVTVELAGSQGKAALTAALEVLDQLPESLRSSVRRVRATSPDAVRLRVDGADVVWGSPDRTPRKAQIYAALRSVPAKVYDVSSPDTPVTR